ncbi:MAG: hypothetical protein HZB44_01640 [Actinobacteria bacterium]|nr:hypothetical protein [Actinomycetota bacterium]
MPDRSRKKKKARDLNILASQIVSEATKEEKPPYEPEAEKNPAVVELGRKGGLKGGKARAEKLSPERRREIAKKAAQARWKSKSKE